MHSDYADPNIDFAGYLAEFTPTEPQLEQLASIAQRKPQREYWSNADLDEASFEAAIVFAPPKSSGQNLDAYRLLKRCENRKWAFRFKTESDTRYSGPISGKIYEYGLVRGLVRYSGTTYGDLFDRLLDSGLVEEAPLHQKLWGSQTVKTLKIILTKHALSTSGSKEDLLDRLLTNVEQRELEDLAKDVVLYQATDEGKDALRLLRALWLTGPGSAFRRAVLAHRFATVSPT